MISFIADMLILLMAGIALGVLLYDIAEKRR